MLDPNRTLTRVYYDAPIAPFHDPCPWTQLANVGDTTGVGIAGETQHLTVVVDDGEPYYRGEYRNLWVDPFQSHPGAGYHSLMVVGWSGGHGGPIGDRAYNLTGARFSMEVRAHKLRLAQRTRLLFWIQFRDEAAEQAMGRYVNLAYIARPLDRALGYTAPFEREPFQKINTEAWTPFAVDFDQARLHDWLHLGSAPQKAHIYDTSVAPHVPTHLTCFEHWNWDCGITAFYGPQLPSADDCPRGRLEFRKLALDVDSTLNGLNEAVTGRPPLDQG